VPSLGEFIRQQRKLTAVSMRQFANLAGISNPYLSQIERGIRVPSEQVVQSIAGALHMSAEALYDQAGVRRRDAASSQVIDAIRADGSLSGRQKQALIEMYEAFAAVNERPSVPPVS
jgi:transcriptional regulator with XRE-family HTH domain